ncbi:MAG: VWA domain-containing protein [Desulfovermiculus sp.]
MTESSSTDLLQRKQQLAKRLEELGANSESPQIRRRLATDSSVACAYLLIDCSGSMGGAKLSQAKAGSIGFSESAFLKGYSVGVISFSSLARLVTEPLTDIFKLRERIDLLEVEGTTNMAEALELSAEKFPSSSRGRAVVVVTDGMPDSADAVLKAAKRLRSLGIDIITIGTNDADQGFLEQIASRKELAVHVPRKHLELGIKTAAKLLPDGSK